MKYVSQSLTTICTRENIYLAWSQFARGKKNRQDVNFFYANLAYELDSLYCDVLARKYKHAPYSHFVLLGIKKRDIHKASVRDRVLHRLVYNVLIPVYEPIFIYDSYSSRKNKGVHKALLRYKQFFREITKNYAMPAYTLSFDIKRCFESIPQDRLLNVLSRRIIDQYVYDLCGQIIKSFDKGLALGNLTSQIFINIYLHELDRYCKHNLRIKYYIRYADDVVCMFRDKDEAIKAEKDISLFCLRELGLVVHKQSVASIYSGADLLGWRHFKKHRTLRRSTANRVKIKYSRFNAASYQGLLKWGSTNKLKSTLEVFV